jgi:hypothetical protein
MVVMWLFEALVRLIMMVISGCTKKLGLGFGLCI